MTICSRSYLQREKYVGKKQKKLRKIIFSDFNQSEEPVNLPVPVRDRYDDTHRAKTVRMIYSLHRFIARVESYK